MSEYVKTVGKVVTACADKWKDKGDSNWFTNMYLDFLNNYISHDTFVEEEIETIVGECSSPVHAIGMSLLGLFVAICHLQPTLTYEQTGEVAMRILKGEV